MQAPPDTIFSQVNNLHAWHNWSPWAKMDPKANTTFEGPEVGVDSKMSWSSENSEVGVGSMTITNSMTNDMIVFALDFKEPFEGQNNAEFIFQPEGDKTKVTWTMYGKNNFIGKAMGLIFNCDKMVGGKFEEGLANLKKVVEPKSSNIEIAEVK